MGPGCDRGARSLVWCSRNDPPAAESALDTQPVTQAFSPSERAEAIAFLESLSAELRVYIDEWAASSGWRLVCGDDRRHALRALGRIAPGAHFRVRATRLDELPRVYPKGPSRIGRSPADTASAPPQSFSPHHHVWVSARDELYNVWIDHLEGSDWDVAMFFHENGAEEPVLRRVPRGTDLQNLTDVEMDRLLRGSR